MLLRAVVVYPVVIILFRVLGRGLKFNARPYDRAVEVILGAAAAGIIVTTSVPLWQAIGMLVLLAALHKLLDYVSLWNPVKKLLVGEPLTLIEHGTVRRDNLLWHHISLEQLLGGLREKGYHRPAEIESALLETSGELSVIPYAEARPVTTGDLHLNPPPTGRTRLLVSDGVVQQESLRSAGLSEGWLREQLKAKGAGSTREVLLATLDANGELFVLRDRDLPLMQAVLSGVPDGVRLPLPGFPGGGESPTHPESEVQPRH